MRSFALAPELREPSSPSYGNLLLLLCLIASPPLIVLPHKDHHARYSRTAFKSRKKVERAFAEHLAGEDDLEDEEEEDNNLDLLFQLFRNFVRRISNKATRIARTILPPALSTDVVAFSVNGVVLLSVLWISKALLEVACAVGSAIFFSLLVIRSIWSVFTYIQSQSRPSGTDDYGSEIGDRPDFTFPGAPA